MQNVITLTSFSRGGGVNTWELCQVNKRLTLTEKEEQARRLLRNLLLLTGDLAHSLRAFTSAPVTLSEPVLNQNASPASASQHSLSNYTVGTVMQDEKGKYGFTFCWPEIKR